MTVKDAIDLRATREAVNAQSRRVTPGIEDIATYQTKQVADQSHREVLGPLLPGKVASGVVRCHGEPIATWGDPSKEEMLFSATKSLVSTVAGIAFDRGLLRDVDEPVVRTVPLSELQTSPGEQITWAHLLQQTSSWDGVLWDKPATVDEQSKRPGSAAPGTPPGEGWAYNDVRVNLLCLALTVLLKQELQTVLDEEILRPLGVEGPWVWHGYSNSFVRAEERELKVVSGGAHWGGGMWMSANDLALVGELYLRRGSWKDKQLLSEEWIARTFQPCRVNPDYGFLWWRNDARRVFPNAPSTGQCARGNGGKHLLWIDPARDLVVASHWGDDVALLLEVVSEATPAQS